MRRLKRLSACLHVLTDASAAKNSSRIILPDIQQTTGHATACKEMHVTIEEFEAYQTQYWFLANKTRHFV